MEVVEVALGFQITLSLLRDTNGGDTKSSRSSKESGSVTRTQLAEKGPPGFNRLLLILHLFARSHNDAIAGADRGLQAWGLPSWPMINDPGWARPGPEEKGDGDDRRIGHQERRVNVEGKKKNGERQA
ncbi:hypothetical protein CRENBAI_007370 [Crenichthys baileyi]|uniref:Uncharacterized protein n=1 Tax=Crenichthys baileyi TaxID=28760 RepID=A0AAV9R728_9TELE